MLEVKQVVSQTFTSQSLETSSTLFERVETLAQDFATRTATHDKDGSFPFENFKPLHQADLLSLTIPQDLGGQDLGLASICQAGGLAYLLDEDGSFPELVNRENVKIQ